MSEEKREMLKDRVVDLVKDFANREGGINRTDLDLLFGASAPEGYFRLVATALANLPIKFSEPQP